MRWKIWNKPPSRFGDSEKRYHNCAGAIYIPGKKVDNTPTETFLKLLIFFLEHSQPVTLGELAKTLEISKQSVLRYLDRIDLTYFGTLVRQKGGKEIVFIFEPNVKKIRDIGSSLYKLPLTALKKGSIQKKKF